MAARYTPEQLRNAQLMVERAQRENIDPRLPLIAGLVESNLTNVQGGHADSVGLFQMRESIWNKGKYQNYQQDVNKQLDWFFDTAKTANRGSSLGEWAANIERPAEQYRGRYAQRMKDAEAILAQLGGGAGGGVGSSTLSTPSPASTPAATAITGNRTGALQRELLSNLMQGNDPRQGLTNSIGTLATITRSRREARSAPMQTAPNPTIVPQGDVSQVVEAGGSEYGSKAVQLASKYIGTPYLWGGSTPQGFDCSGLMQYVYGKLGVKIPRVSQDQFKASRPVDTPAPGDMVFFTGYTKDPNNPGHVGMYIGNGKYLQAPKTGDVVKISDLSERSDYLGARRPAGV